MLKKLLILNLFLAALLGGAVNAFAFDWGIIDNYEDTYEDYAVLKLIKGRPIKYFISPEKTTKATASSNNNKDDVLISLNKQLNDEYEGQKNKKIRSLITRAFNVWPRDTKNNIEWAKREQEFDDIMPYLSRKVILQEVSNENEADITFRFDFLPKVKEECGEESGGCFMPNEKIILAPSLYDETGKTNAILEERTYFVLIHEIGHYFGLTDQYEDTGQDSLVHSTFNRINTRDAVMGSSRNPALYCDDVDGFINVMDLTLAIDAALDTRQYNRKTSYKKTSLPFSKRAQKGWASFCNGKKNGKGQPFKDEFYKEARLIDKPDYISNFNLYKFDADGNIASKYSMDPFDFVGKGVRLNEDGLPAVMFDDKNKIRYTYDYDALREGTLKIDVLRNNEYYPSFRYEKMYGDDGFYSWINIKKDYDETMVNISNDKCFITEDFHPVPNKSLEVLTMNFDRSNNLISTSYESLATFNPTGIRKLAPFMISKKGNVCALEISNREIIKLQGENQIIYQDQQTIDNLLRQHNLSKNILIKEMADICKMQTSPAYTDKNRTKCKYFRDIDNLLRY